MAATKPRIVIIGAGMAGITAANRLYAAVGSSSPPPFELMVVEGGDRIGGRIVTTEFGGDRIEMGATWIHGIGGSPVHAIASEIRALESEQPWECMDGTSEGSSRCVTVAEGGFRPDRSLVEPVESLYKSLMSYAQKKKPAEQQFPVTAVNGGGSCKYDEIAITAFESLNESKECLSIGSYLRKGLSLYWGLREDGENEAEVVGSGGGRRWTRKMLEEGVFEVFENTQRTYTSAGDLTTLDLVAESEYVSCSAEEITIAKGYTSVVNHLASALPPGLVQLGKKVAQIDWGSGPPNSPNPVKIHFSDGSSMDADHVIVTVSLGVLKAGIGTPPASPASAGLRFSPPLPSSKAEAIQRLGFGVVNKLFVKIAPKKNQTFPFLRMVFHGREGSREDGIPRWMRRTASVFPIYAGSRVLLSWFAGEEALQLETLPEDEVAEGVARAIEEFLGEGSHGRVEGVARSRWGTNPLFLGSYSYVAVGSSGDDLDRMAEPLDSNSLRVLFAGEATHRTHYSTTHGAYFSGLREADRLLKHYQFLGV